MPFNYTDNNNLLDTETSNLLETMDNYMLQGKWSIHTLAELHNKIQVEIVDSIPAKKYTIVLTNEEARDLLSKWGKENEAIDAYNKRIIEECRQNQNCQNPEEKLLGRHDTDWLSDEIDKSGGGDVVLNVEHRINGYYTRKDGRGYIALLNNGRTSFDNTCLMAITYVHEMMHALMDSRMKPNMNKDEYAEEELAEFGMLMFMDEFCAHNPKYSQLLTIAFDKVLKKQQSIGLSHYGFGAELYENYRSEDWLTLALNGAALIGAGNGHYQELENAFTGIWSDDLATKQNIAKELKAFLCDKATVKYSAPVYKSESVPSVGVVGTSFKEFIMEFTIDIEHGGLIHKDQFGVPRAQGLRYLLPGSELLYIRERINPVDTNAIALFRPDGRQLSYVPRTVNLLLAEQIDMGRTLVFKVKEVNGEGSYRDRWIKIEVYR